MKVTLWLYVQNCGDGDFMILFFESKEEAEKYAAEDDERQCDDIFSKTLEFDQNGKLLNPSKLSDRF